MPGSTVIALDNLKRRGSELALRRLASGGVEFRHGDIRNREDLADAGSLDLLIECSAEPSVQAGLAGGDRYLINTNLVGTINCLDHARRHEAAVVFLSTSRVYPIAALRELPLVATETRFVLPEANTGPGWSAHGIAENFPLTGSRSLYGATKLCSELIIAEYVALYGFGGAGLQVRDALHVDDLYRLIRDQVAKMSAHSGKTYNVGGGAECSVSLAELTETCVERAGRRLAITSQPETNPVDVPYYVTDYSAVTAATGWRPRLSMTDILDDIFGWLREHRRELEAILK